MRNVAVRLVIAVLTACLLTMSILALLPDVTALDVHTDIVGYPTIASFNIDLYFWAYGLVVVFFPLVAIGLYLTLSRLFVGRLGPWRPLPQAHQNIERLPEADGWREWAVAVGRTLFVGCVLGLELAIFVGQASEVVLLTSAAYIVGVTLAGALIERLSSHPRCSVMSGLNVFMAPLTVLGLWGVSRSTEVTVASSGEVHRYPWVPTWLAVGVAAALLATLAVCLRRGSVDVRTLERRAVLLVAAPVAVLVSMAAIPGELGTFDAFEEGQALEGSALVLEGAFPWRDVMLTHGLLHDVARGLVGLTAFDDSRWGLVAADSLIFEPLAWVALYYLCAYLLWTNWVFLAGTQILLVTGHFAEIDARMILVPLCLLLLAALFAKPTALRAVAFTVAVAVQVVVTPEALVLAAAAFGVLGAFEFSYREPGRRVTAGYPRVKVCLATLGVIAISWSVLLAAFGALDDWLFGFAATIPGHRLTGGIAPLVPKTEFEVVAPIALVLFVYAFVVARVRLRAPFAYQDWLMVAMGVLTLLYYTKFLGRMDSDHLAQSFVAALPLLFYVVFRSITYGESWLVTRTSARGLTWFPSRHTLTIPLLLVVVFLAPEPLHDAIRSAPGHFTAEVAVEPEVAAIGYTRPGENDTRVIASLDSALRLLLEPGDTVFDFSNSPGLFHYVLDLTPSTRYYHVSFAIRQRTQSDLIRRLEASPPGAVVVGIERTFNNLPEWDGASNQVRHYDVSEYLLDHYVPVQEIGDGFILMARRDRGARADQTLYFRGYPCDWRYVPNFLSSRPSDVAETVTMPLRGSEHSKRFAVRFPTNAAEYRWLELRSASPFAEGVFNLDDRGGGYTRRSISFKTLGRGETTVRVRVGACSQWRGYEPGTLYLSTDVPQSIREVRLLR